MHKRPHLYLHLLKWKNTFWIRIGALLGYSIPSSSKVVLGLIPYAHSLPCKHPWARYQPLTKLLTNKMVNTSLAKDFGLCCRLQDRGVCVCVRACVRVRVCVSDVSRTHALWTACFHGNRWLQVDRWTVLPLPRGTGEGSHEWAYHSQRLLCQRQSPHLFC